MWSTTSLPIIGTIPLSSRFGEPSMARRSRALNREENLRVAEAVTAAALIVIPMG